MIGSLIHVKSYFLTAGNLSNLLPNFPGTLNTHLVCTKGSLPVSRIGPDCALAMYAFSGIEATQETIETKPATATINARSPSGRTLSKAFSSRGDRFWSNIVPSFVKRDAAANTEAGGEATSASTLFSCCCSGSSSTKR
ncbi:hypothetical protein Ndes2437A_g04835 [Nannochloris sp. 'desiccata']